MSRALPAPGTTATCVPPPPTTPACVYVDYPPRRNPADRRSRRARLRARAIQQQRPVTRRRRVAVRRMAGCARPRACTVPSGAAGRTTPAAAAARRRRSDAGRSPATLRVPLQAHAATVAMADAGHRCRIAAAHRARRIERRRAGLRLAQSAARCRRHGRRAQILLGWPWLPASALDVLLPPALSLHRLQAVAIDKGCYPGQEIVARLH